MLAKEVIGAKPLKTIISAIEMISAMNGAPEDDCRAAKTLVADIARGKVRALVPSQKVLLDQVSRWMDLNKGDDLERAE